MKARRRQARILKRDECRRAVFYRDGGKCKECGKRLVLHMKDAAHEFQVAHIHEVRPRSLGGDPLNPDECVTLCYECHASAHNRV